MTSILIHYHCTDISQVFHTIYASSSSSLFAAEVQQDIQRDRTQCEPDCKALDNKHSQPPGSLSSDIITGESGEVLITGSSGRPIISSRM